MKIPENTTTIEGGFSGQRVDMEIDPKARAFVMQALQKLYSDNEMAVLRELATNARDAHIEVSRGHLPIEISLPKADLDPYLTIKDNGPGLSIEDITNVYSRYGVSTKRDTNEQTGSLGFGCKSPLAYTDQFTLTSICDGVKIEVVVSKDDRGGNMRIVDTSSTTEPSGVTINIPVARYNNFANKAARLFRFWEPGTVLVDGKDPERIQGRKITDDLMVIDGRRSYLVMGNVPYPVEDEYLNHGLRDGYSLLVRVPLGSVEFTPSREALDYSLTTRAVLKQIEADFAVAIQNAVQNDIDQCKTKPEVVPTIVAWHKTLPETRVAGDYTYKGQKVPRIYDLPGADKIGGPRIIVTQTGSAKLSKHERRQRLDLSWWVNAILVVNYDRDGFTPTTKKKLNKYAQDKGLSADHYLLLPINPGRKLTGWFESRRVVEFEDIAAIKLPRTYGRNRVDWGDRIPGSYDIVQNGTPRYGVEAHTIDQTKSVFYQVGAINSESCYRDLLAEHYPGYTIVVFPPNREGKFTRNFPNAITAHKAVAKVFTKWKNSLTPNQKMSIAIHYGPDSYLYRNSLMKLDPMKIDDPVLRRAVKLAQQPKLVTARNQYIAFRNALVIGIKSLDLTFENPLEKYPLYDNRTLRNDPDHIYQYLNAMHAYLTQPGA